MSSVQANIVSSTNELLNLIQALPVSERAALVKAICDDLPVPDRAIVAGHLIYPTPITFGGHSFTAGGHIFHLSNLTPEACAQLIESIAELIRSMPHADKSPQNC
jgi:hypothetical protein